ncbi:hypothetical protein [Bosea sp. 124]|uniref:hypothetical protein n=1 Tax=Bosea sp. 124 TaxID=2135642 RepID=UPI0011B1F15C|nr:hypothetical protein [Bosea sp. 124]
MTQEQRAGLARLMLCWPEGRAALRLMSASDIPLLDLCEAYNLACNAAAYWSKSNSANAAEIADEYRSLVPEIEAEARQRVNGPRGS